jgi:ABC-2 type transport system ATP-binding protein
MGDGLIQFKKVTKSFGKNVVLNAIDLEITEGKIVGIIGASGEGKSTILKMIVSFYKPTKGEIFYKKKNIVKSRKILSKLFGISIEEGSFYETLSAKENLSHFGRLYGVKEKVLNHRIGEILHLIGLEAAEKTLARDLSLGMKKRLDIGCALIHNPSILILDEPTADLDPLLRKQMMGLIKKINSHGTTVILTTQLLGEAEEICDEVAILFNEKIIEEGTPARIKKKYKSSNLDGVFHKIFSDKNRKTYQESAEKKTKLKILEKGKKKKSLITNSDKIDELIEKAKEKEDSDSFLEEVKGAKK